MKELIALKSKGINVSGRMVTCATPSWVAGDFFLGMDDGSMLEVGEEAPIPDSVPFQLTDEREAVNGLAWTADGRGFRLAASTRSEIKVHYFDLNTSGYSAERLPRGAHGVYSTVFGGFIAPLGPDGLISLHPGPGNTMSRATLPLKKNSPYIYKLAKLNCMLGESEVFVAACRTDGLVGIGVSPSRSPAVVQTAKPKIDFDCISVCSIESQEYPRAIAALGRDRSIDFVYEFLKFDKLTRVKLAGMAGTPYKIGTIRNQLLVLTSEGLYCYPGQVEAFWRGEPVGKPPTLYRRVFSKAFDFAVIDDQWLLILTAQHVIQIHVSEILPVAALPMPSTPVDAIRSVSRLSTLSAELAALPGTTWHDSPPIVTFEALQVSSE